MTTLKAIKNAVEAATGLELASGLRDDSHVRARSCFIILANEFHSGVDHAVVAGLMGRTRMTMYNAHRRALELQEFDGSFRKLCDQIKERLTGEPRQHQTIFKRRKMENRQTMEQELTALTTKIDELNTWLVNNFNSPNRMTVVADRNALQTEHYMLTKKLDNVRNGRPANGFDLGEHSAVKATPNRK